MSLHAPPAYLTELQQTPDGLQQWDAHLAACLYGAIKRPTVPPNHVPQFLPRPPAAEGAARALPIYWNAFPKNLLSLYGRERALAMADRLWRYRKDSGGKVLIEDPCKRHSNPRPDMGWGRPHDEYCEWRVERHPASNRIERIVFTAETPDYWTAMFGGFVDGVVIPSTWFAGDAVRVAQQYFQYTGARVQPADLTDSDGNYDPVNRWNTSDGIVHMCHPSNALSAAIRLCVDGTLLFSRSDGTLETYPEALCCAAGADPNRNSDLTIVGTANALARQGAQLALAEPTGIYIHDVDTSSWRMPGVDNAAACWRVVRGSSKYVLRIVVEPPPQNAHMLDEMTIDGEPLMYGGQIAECITMRMSVLALLNKPVRNAALAPQESYCVNVSNPARLAMDRGQTSGQIRAFAHDGVGTRMHRSHRREGA